jgi:hypothetical protein
MKQNITFTPEEVGMIPSLADNQEPFDKKLYGSTGGKCPRFSGKAIAAMGEVFRKRNQR